jgi:hypothetical protein
LFGCTAHNTFYYLFHKGQCGFLRRAWAQKIERGGAYWLSSFVLPAFRIVCAALKIRAAD